MSQSKDKYRNAELAKIHILAKTELGMSDDEYRCMLHQITGKESAGKLNWRQRSAVIDHLRSLKEGPKQRNIGDSAQRGKIKALLMAGGKSTAYGDGIAKRICGVERLEWVPESDLYKIITALRKQAKRGGWDLSGE